MGMGMLGAMAGAGQAMEGVGKQMFASSLEQDRQNFLIEKQRMLMGDQEKMRIAGEDRAEFRKNAPFDRANNAIKSALGAEVAISPAEVTELNGNESQSRRGSGLLSGAFTGRPEDIVKSISSIKDDNEKAEAADALEQQLQDAKRNNIESVDGKTRKLSREEAMAVAERALDGDIQAQAALKASKADKYTKIGANDTLLDTTTGKVVYQNKQGEENLRQMFENKLEIEKAKAEFKAQLGIKGSEMPSDAKMAEWLVSNGVAPDMKSAYERVKQGKDKDDVSVQASIFSAISKGSIGEDPKQLWKQAGEMVKASRDGERGTPQQNQQGSSSVTVNGKSVDYGSLKSGETYQSPDGKTRIKK